MPGRIVTPRGLLLAGALSIVSLVALTASAMHRPAAIAPATSGELQPGSGGADASQRRALSGAAGGEQPSLTESLIAADQIARLTAFAQAAQPPLIEILQAADELQRAGIIAGEPTLAESLIAADQMARLVAFARGAQGEPPLVEVLRAVALLAATPAAPAAAAPAPPLPTATSVPAQASAPIGGPGRIDDAFTARIFAGVNQRRAAAGLTPVAAEPRLMSAAADYAVVLAANNWFSHTGPDGSTIVTRVETAGFPFDVQIGEVLAWGSEGWPADGVVQAWMDSPSHRAQIMSPVYRRAGATCYFTSGEHAIVRCVMDFAG